MSNINYKIIAYLGRTPDFLEEVKLQDDSNGQGAYIKEWNATDKPKPTDAQLDALESQADAVEALNQVYANRKKEYPSVQDLVVALYDTDDKAAIDEKRAEIKLKYPKPGA